MDPPVYNDNEPIYIFKRKWDMYIESKINKQKYTTILSFINIIFQSDYKNLLSIKAIEEKQIPKSKKIIKIANNYEFIINGKEPINIINSILNTINYSFVMYRKNNTIFYRVKHII